MKNLRIEAVFARGQIDSKMHLGLANGVETLCGLWRAKHGLVTEHDLNMRFTCSDCQKIALAASEVKSTHSLKKTWNRGARENYTYAYRCVCGWWESGYVTEEYAKEAHWEHVEEQVTR